MHPLPIIFVLDWDGTIAGKVDFQSQAFSLAQTLRKNGFRPKPLPSVLQAFSPKSKLIRPGFGSFVKAMERLYQGQVHFFIYTASEKTWANYEIGLVEKQFGIKFARPIFSREDCVVDQGGQYRKSIAKVYPRICRAVGKHRPLTTEERMYMLENNVIMIDNNAVYTDRPDKMLLCPDYDYAVFENLIEMIPDEARTHPVIHQVILSLINSGHMCPDPSRTSGGGASGSITRDTDFMKELAHSYTWMATRCRAVVNANKLYEHDDFWKHLRKLIAQNGLRRYTPSIIKQLQEASWKHLKLKQRS